MNVPTMKVLLEEQWITEYCEGCGKELDENDGYFGNPDEHPGFCKRCE